MSSLPNIFAPKPSLPDSIFQQAPPESEDPPEGTREFADYKAIRNNVFDRALKAAQEMPPMKNSRHTLMLRDLHYADPPDIPLKKQKAAILGGQTLGRRMRGTWELIDNASGKVLDSKKATVATIPFFSNRGTWVHRGSEYALVNQMRLRPGVFTRVKENGEIESHANIMPGKGPSHRYFLDPSSGSFHMKLGQASLPVMPLARALGASDEELRNAWGPEIFAANAQMDDTKGLDKIYEKVIRKPNLQAPREEKVQALNNLFAQMEMDPEVTRRTLGGDFRNLSKDTLLAITKKLISVGRGEAETDDRDSLAYQHFHGPEDLISERLRMDSGSLRRKLLWGSSFRGNLSNVGVGALTPQVEAAILFSGLGQLPEAVNSSDIFDKMAKVTRMGVGGIASMDSIPQEARNVTPSHAGFIDPIRTVESGRVGVDVFLARGARKGQNGELYSPFIDPKTKRKVWRTPQQVADMIITFPGEMESNSARIAAISKGKQIRVKKSDVDLVLPEFETVMSPMGNMVPLKSTVKQGRVIMGSRMMTQAVPLLKPEAPFLQSGFPGKDDWSFEQEYASHMGAFRAPHGGKVLSVDQDSMRVKYENGETKDLELYHDFPYNTKTFLRSIPKVQAGDTFKPGQLLLKSNYTDDDGATALGLNMRVAYLPDRKAGNYEDAFSISQSAAKRLTSEHMYQHEAPWKGPGFRRGRNNFISLYPSKFNKEILSKMDEDGVIKPGSTVGYKEPLVLLAQQREAMANKIHKRNMIGFEDKSQLWEHHSPGVVTDVVKTPNGAVVVVKTEAEMQVGDKLAGRFGDKGVTARIIPDSEMPHDTQGRPFDILANPLGLVSRGNPVQLIEAALGKISEKTGKVWKPKDFEDVKDMSEWALNELKKHGLSDKEDVIDPKTGRKISNVSTGNRFYMKLHHTAEHGGQGRGTGGGYTAMGEPAKGGEHGSKKLGLLDASALLSHGAYGVLRDANIVRGQRNEDYWLSFMQGYKPPDPKTPKVYEKFIDELKASGINTVPGAGKLNVMALTDKDIEQLAGDREIKNGETVDFDNQLRPIKGGLFDESLTGSHHGNRWSRIRLHEPMPSPVMEEPIRRLLGLTENQFLDVLAGKKELKGQTGPAAISDALKNINVPVAIAQARAKIAGGKKSQRDEAVRALGYLKTAQRLKIHPSEWMLSSVPVLPPRFRPISMMQTGSPLVSDANYLYKEVIEANDNLREMGKLSSDVGEERLALYKTFKAVTGLGDPTHPKLVQKGVQGLLKGIFGSSPKYSTIQSRLLSSTTDLVGRAVITPDSDLDMDSVGLPESRAWDVYQNFVVRNLKRRGMSLMDAARQAKERTPLGRQALIEEMSKRPVIINRAPVLHKFGITAAWPRLTEGDTLRVSPLTTAGFSSDFDGDKMQYHVPADDAAVQDAIERLLPSKNLLSPADFKRPVALPAREFAQGLFFATKNKNNRKPHMFLTVKDAIAAFRRGEVTADDPVEIMR